MTAEIAAFCLVPTVGRVLTAPVTAATQAELAARRTAVGATGRALFVVAESTAAIPFDQAEPRPLTTVRVQQWEQSLTPPHRASYYIRSVWVGEVLPDGTVRPVGAGTSG